MYTRKAKRNVLQEEDRSILTCRAHTSRWLSSVRKREAMQMGAECVDAGWAM